MSVVLYGSPSTASLVVHWLLIELGLDHELRMLDFERKEQKAAEYLAINPAGVVPSLVLDGDLPHAPGRCGDQHTIVRAQPPDVAHAEVRRNGAQAQRSDPVLDRAERWIELLQVAGGQGGMGLPAQARLHHVTRDQTLGSAF